MNEAVRQCFFSNWGHGFRYAGGDLSLRNTAIREISVAFDTVKQNGVSFSYGFSAKRTHFVERRFCPCSYVLAFLVW